MERTGGAVVSRWADTGVEWSARAIAEAVRSGNLHPRRAVEESLARIAERDPEIGAFQLVRAGSARTEADALASHPDLATMPLAGVPIAIKDNVAVAGEPMARGSRTTSTRPQLEDHPLIKRFRAAGAIIVGITRIPEFSMWGATDSPFGITRNPWNLNRSPGGSSGGSAAAMAAGMVALAHGNDGLGSVRIPAAACGLVGLKPGHDLAAAGLGETNWYGLADNGILASSPDDAALGISVLVNRPDLAEPVQPPSRLVIAASLRSPIPGVRADAAAARAVNSTATLLARAGHEVSTASPVYSPGVAVSALSRWVAVAADEVYVAGAENVEPRMRTHARIGRLVHRTPALDRKWQQRFSDAACQFLSAYDLLVTPLLAKPPMEAKDWHKTSWLTTIRATIPWAPYAAPWNVIGFPAIAVPTGALHPRTRTPMAVQLVARPGQEELLLAVAAQLAALRPWPRVAPRYR